MNPFVVFFARDIPFYIFPRSRIYLFSYKHTHYGHSLGPIAIKDILPSFNDYADSLIMNDYETGNPGSKFKDIDYRVYTHLFCNTQPQTISQHSRETTITKKKISLCFLKKTTGSNNFSIYHKVMPELVPENPDFFNSLNVVLTVNHKNTGKLIYLECMNNRAASNGDLTIPVRDFDNNYMAEVMVCIRNSSEDLPAKENCSFEICAKLFQNTAELKRVILPLAIHYHNTDMNGTDEDPFLKYWEKNDIFILPGKSTNDHELLIKRLQIYNNQVLARHQKLNDFQYVKEDGISNLMDMRRQFSDSIRIFKETKSGDRTNKNTEPSLDYLKTVFSYDLTQFGQADNLVGFLAHNYSVERDRVKGLVFDRKFLYGDIKNPTEMKDIQGLENLYKKVVQVFLEQFIGYADQYANFGNGDENYRWLSRPGENSHYQRGKLVIEAGMNLKIYQSEDIDNNDPVDSLNDSNGSLPPQTIIRFGPGKDKNDLDISEIYRYKVASVTLPGQAGQTNDSWYIPLSYENKQRCDDWEHEENYCNYVSIPPSTGSEYSLYDTTSLQAYQDHYGVPYYLSTANLVHTGGKVKFDMPDTRLRTKTPQIRNWYSYPDNPPSKPNTASNSPLTRGIGLDCSGLVMNCLLDIRPENMPEEMFFKDSEVAPNKLLRREGENVTRMGLKRTRVINFSLEHNGNTLVQPGDLIYSGTHIAICLIDESQAVLQTYLSSEQKNNKKFTIIHNYGGKSIRLENIWYEGGFFKRTLKGSFMHWGVNLNNMDNRPNSFAGRIYLWY